MYILIINLQQFNESLCHGDIYVMYKYILGKHKMAILEKWYTWVVVNLHTLVIVLIKQIVLF